MATCPNCHEQAMPDKEKLRVGALRDHRCPHCGVRLKLHWAWVTLFILPGFLLIVASRHLDLWPSLGFLICIAALQLLIVVRFVPLVAREPRSD